MNWGPQDTSKAELPERKRKPVEVFDLKEFVKEKKKSNLFNILEGSNGGGPNIPAAPFNPFAMPSDDNNDFNVDDLVKKIDAKIAELEEEERKEKEKLEKEKQSKEATIPAIDSNDIKPQVLDTIEENVENKVQKPIVKEEIKDNTDDISDDQFFDDFFADE